MSSLGPEDVHSLSAWFNFVPMSLVNRDNFVEWLYWAIFSSPVEEGEEFTSEVEEYLVEMKQWDGIELIPGHTPDIKPIRVTLDPVRTIHRPLIWYLVRMCNRSREIAFLTIHLIACCLYRHLFFSGPQFAWFQTSYLGKPPLRIPSTTVHYVFQTFSYPAVILVPPAPLQDEISCFIPAWNRGISNLSVTWGMVNVGIYRLGYCPTFLSSGISPKRIPIWVSLS